MTYAFLALLVWLPLPLGSNRQWAIAIMEVWAYALAGAVLWLLMKQKIRLPAAFRRSWPIILLLTLNLLWIAFQSMPLPHAMVEAISPHSAKIHAMAAISPPSFSSLSLDAHMSFLQFQKGLALLIIFCLTLILIDSEKKLRWLMHTILMCGLFQATYGSIMVLSGMEYSFFIKKTAYLGNATGTFINRNHLAGYLEMSLAVGIGLMLSQLSPGHLSGWRSYTRHIVQLLLGPKARIRMVLIALCIALVLTHSRMGNSAFFTTLFVVSAVYLLLCRHKTRSTTIFLASLVALDVLIVGSWFGIQKVVERLEKTSSATETRDEVVRDSLLMIQDFPVTGTGAGNFFTSYPMYRQSDVRGFYHYAHNDYVQFLSEQGLVGCLLLALVILLTYFSIFKSFRTRRSSLMLGAAFSSCFGLTAILIHSTVDFNLQIPANAAMFMLLLALAPVSLHTGKHKKTRRHRNREII